jgi:hypothetical protein
LWSLCQAARRARCGALRIAFDGAADIVVAPPENDKTPPAVFRPAARLSAAEAYRRAKSLA